VPTGPVAGGCRGPAGDCGGGEAGPRGEGPYPPRGAAVRVSLRGDVPLRRRKIVKKSLVPTLLVLLAGGVVSVFVAAFAAAPTDTPPPDDKAPDVRFFVAAVTVAWFTFYAVLLAWYPLYQYLAFRNYDYALEGTDLVIRKGALAPREYRIPLAAITDVYVDRDGLDAALGLADVHVATARPVPSRFSHLDGVDEAGSETLRKVLLDRSRAARGESARD